MPVVGAFVILFLMSQTDPVVSFVAALILVIGAIVYSHSQKEVR